MLTLSETHQKTISSFITNYDASFWHKYFLADGLKKAIRTYKNRAHSTEIAPIKSLITAALSSQDQQENSILRPFIESSLIQSYKRAEQAGLLNEDSVTAYFTIILAHQNPIPLVHALCTFKFKITQTPQVQSHYTQEWIDLVLNALIKHDKPHELVQALSILGEKAPLFAQQNLLPLNALATHKAPQQLAQAFLSLDALDLFSPDSSTSTHNALALHTYPKLHLLNYIFELLQSAAALFQRLQQEVRFNKIPAAEKQHLIALIAKEQLLTQENLDCILAHRQPEAIAAALELLDSTEVLRPWRGFGTKLFDGMTDQWSYNLSIFYAQQIDMPDSKPETLLTSAAGVANVKAVIEHQDPLLIAQIFSEILNPAGLLIGKQAPKNRALVVAQPDPKAFSDCLLMLKEAWLLEPELAQANFELLSKHQNAADLLKALQQLAADKKLTQAKFEALATHPHPFDFACSLNSSATTTLNTEAIFNTSSGFGIAQAYTSASIEDDDAKAALTFSSNIANNDALRLRSLEASCRSVT